MKTIVRSPAPAGWKSKAGATANSERGFSLMELMVAMAMFLVMCAPAFLLFNQQQTTAMTQQGQTGLNVALRNAVSQIQMDIVNGGTGQFPGANVPGWPVGVTIVNNVVAPGASCYTPATFTYGVNCFDKINIIAAANPATYPPINASDSTGGSSNSNCSTTSTGTAYGQAATGLTLAQTAANYKASDQLLFLTSASKFITSVVLTANAAVAGSAVRFTFNATAANGSNTSANDPLDITTDGSDTANKLTTTFCGGDWILKLAPIVYQVDSTNPADPILTRTQSGSTANVMEQVIGFKVGATIWNSGTDVVSTQYNYDASTYTNVTTGDQAYNFTLVRSVRISIIGRTVPTTNPNYQYRNTFDNGAYQVEGVAVVVNPRNMSMND